jgi:hypothetical protein
LAELTQGELRCCTVAAAESHGCTCPSVLLLLELLVLLSLLLLLLLLLLLVNAERVLGLRCWSRAERVRANGAG